jgi:hypothetical protein
MATRKRSTAKKVARAAETPSVTTVAHGHLKALTRAARIGLALEANPKHPSRAEYQRELAGHRAQWGALTPDARAQVKAQAATISDMTPDVIASAVTTLED